MSDAITAPAVRQVNQATLDLIISFEPKPLSVDVRYFAAGVDRLLLSRPRAQINDNMFGALVSLASSIGLRTLETSALMRKVNARDYTGAVPEFAKFNRDPNGKVLRVLTRRRLIEANLFCSFPTPVVPG